MKVSPINSILAFTASLILAGFASQSQAQVSCDELKYGSQNYSQSMDALAKQAQLPDEAWNRYDEDLVRALCSGDTASVDKLIDAGYTTTQEASKVGLILGRPFTPKQRTTKGQSFIEIRKKFSAMGSCSACADNIAQYYVKEPQSQCGQLAQKALNDNPGAIQELIAFPDYCQWKY